MTNIHRRDLLRGMAVAGLVGVDMRAATAAEPVTLRLGYGAAAEEQVWLLIAKPDIGKYQGKLYKLDATRFRGSDKRLQAFAADAIDLYEGSATGIMAAAGEGVKAKIIASISRESKKGFRTSFFALASSSIKTVADMKGKNVGINGFQSAGELWLRAALQKNGMSEKDVTVTPVPFPAMQAALTSGKIDVGEFPQPFAAILEHKAKVRKLFDSKYGVPFEEELIVIAGKDQFLHKHAKAIRAFLSDVKDATHFYLTHTKEARQILIDKKMVRVGPDVYLNMHDYYRDPTLRPSIDDLKKMQELQMKAGFQKKAADINSLVDLSYLPK